MGYVSFSMPRDIVIKFMKAGNIKNFIETGTYKGNTSFWAAKNFQKVYTIEIDPAISKETSSKPDCPENITFFVGNSKNVLPGLVNELKERSLFWLDGHWCNVSEFGKDDECPLIDELKSIRHLTDAVVLIDDARAFLGPMPPPHDNSQWPRIDKIMVQLKTYFPENFCTIVDDVIYSIPPDLIPVFNEDWIKNYQERFFGKPSLFDKAINKFKNIFFGKK